MVPFFLNDFAYIEATTAEAWLVADYASKAIMLALVWIYAPFRQTVFAALSLPKDWIESVVLAAGVVLVVLACDAFLEPTINAAFPGSKLFTFPEIEQTWLHWFDLSFGLLLTALSEEICCRAVARHILGQWWGAIWIVVLASAFVFAAAHWSNGLGGIATAFVAGVVLMGLYLRTRSLWPPIAAHFVANFLLFY